MATLAPPAPSLSSRQRVNVDTLLAGRALVRQFVSGTNSASVAGVNVIAPDAGVIVGSEPRREEGRAAFVFTPPAQSVPFVRGFAQEQVFEGTVISVNPADGTFTARLVDLTSQSPDEEGEFALDELNGDEHLAVPGALFTWAVGLQTRGTTKQRVSDIRFRRLPAFTQAAIQKAQTEAVQLAEALAAQDASEAFTARPR